MPVSLVLIPFAHTHTRTPPCTVISCIERKRGHPRNAIYMLIRIEMVQADYSPELAERQEQCVRIGNAQRHSNSKDSLFSTQRLFARRNACRIFGRAIIMHWWEDEDNQVPNLCTDPQLPARARDIHSCDKLLRS